MKDKQTNQSRTKRTVGAPNVFHENSLFSTETSSSWSYEGKIIKIWGNRILSIKIYFVLQNNFILKEGKINSSLHCFFLQKQKMTRAFQNQGNSYVTRMDIRFIPDNIAVLD